MLGLAALADADHSKHTPPSLIIGGLGKCGTNYVAYVIKQYGGVPPLSETACRLERARQGYCGEVNWPCTENHWTQPLFDKYITHFDRVPKPKDVRLMNFTFDKSTTYTRAVCAPLIFNALVGPTFRGFIFCICDPLVALWSRFNQVRKFSNFTVADFFVPVRYIAAHGIDTLPAEFTANQGQVWWQGWSMVHVLENLHVYRKKYGQKLSVIIAEKSKACPDYVSSAISRLLGRDLIRQEAASLVHASESFATTLSRDNSFSLMVSLLKPRFTQLYLDLQSYMYKYYKDDLGARLACSCPLVCSKMSIPQDGDGTQRRHAHMVRARCMAHL
mgnify:CR=1 FL=1